MIPFMMWQSAAIAAGFGTYFQFAKRRVSAMSNEDFNKADPHELVNSMYEDIVKQIPSSFAKVDSLTPVMLQSMNVMLDQAVKWLQGAITGNIFGTPNPVNPVDPEFGEPTPELSTELLDPSFAEVQQWRDTKIAIIHAHQLDQYTSKAQSFIISEHRRRNPETIPDETIPIDTLPGKVRHFAYNPSAISNITMDAINAAFLVSNQKGFLILGVQLNAFQKIINLNRSNADFQRGTRGKKAIQNMILAANEDLKIDTGLN